MNKSELRETLQRSLSCSTSEADRVVGAFLEAVVEGLQKDGSVQLLGFGSFHARPRPAREVRNPGTGEPVQVPAGTTVQFRAGKSLKASL